MANSPKEKNGVPPRKRGGNTITNSNDHQWVRYNGFSLESSGSNCVKRMKATADMAISTIGRIKQEERSGELASSISQMIIGGVLKKYFGATDLKEEDKDPDITVTPGMSFSEMMNRPMSHESGVIVEGYIMKGQISFGVAGADSGKTIYAVDTGIAAASGKVPTFLAPDSLPSEKMNVIFYRLEDRAGELPKRYGAGEVFSALPFTWIMRGDLQAPTEDCLIDDIKGRCKTIVTDTLIIVDPLSKLIGFDAAKFIREMEDLQTEYAKKGIILSVFCTAHTEEDKPWKPLTTDQILGGDKLLQQAGSVFSIRKERRGQGYRFLQTLKPPKGDVDKDTVSVVKFVGRDENHPGSYTHIEYVEEKTIQQALPMKQKAEEEETPKPDGRGEPWLDAEIEKLKELVKTHTAPEIADELGCDEQRVRKKANSLGLKIKSMPRGPKPKQKRAEDQEQE